ncbi:hypothetical protein BC835DRAFT_369738 [Cytidiella melzeri]|nr:hypothetical protein BC835DRAFT_369738 [Cytidiella melzeri]
MSFETLFPHFKRLPTKHELPGSSAQLISRHFDALIQFRTELIKYTTSNEFQSTLFTCGLEVYEEKRKMLVDSVKELCDVSSTASSMLQSNIERSVDYSLGPYADFDKHLSCSNASDVFFAAEASCRLLCRMLVDKPGRIAKWKQNYCALQAAYERLRGVPLESRNKIEKIKASIQRVLERLEKQGYY